MEAVVRVVVGEEVRVVMEVGVKGGMEVEVEVRVVMVEERVVVMEVGVRAVMEAEVEVWGAVVQMAFPVGKEGREGRKSQVGQVSVMLPSALPGFHSEHSHFRLSLQFALLICDATLSLSWSQQCVVHQKALKSWNQPRLRLGN
jgi:hypothetical protein